ncbi:acetyl-CoA carboxylase biotin carboxylase subunit [Albibacterium indicum]|uniref:acetyl-CoA carboxylase biotin carboxylase subunit n=1 Tax=Albibacterium indicum TaxID=2292082 RepID=UPI000E486543|nr:acetyl-CoA carboxylase biotin carboxylase subunit [Pedobacter indicus]
MKKILIANRGEIAIRVIRSAHEMGISTVAVYSDADRTALHVQHADEAVYIGKSSASDSYLSISKIIEACKQTNVDAVHPGYGFLSENPLFAKALEKESIKLIGPSSEAMELMGNKLSAKKLALAHKIPLLKGTSHPISDTNEALQQARDIGFPILIKAAAGGGGKGMRIVQDQEDFLNELKLAISEASSAFGDGSVFLERYISAPKHVEIQVLADEHGNSIYLFERECSIQRRHQKVIEEAPCSVLTPAIREKMGKCALDLVKACNYTGAGTVEFIVDNQLNFYFLEMNTRLQVEHPITELITGVDLVKEQINIAQGKVLSLTQEDVNIQGHAIELRIYAEDPKNNFLPDTGMLDNYKIPSGPGVRVDNAYDIGMEVSVYYDPMIAKLSVWGKDRHEAIQRMKRAITEYKITGIKNTLNFGSFVMDHPAFQDGSYNTKFIDIHFQSESIENCDKDALISALIGNYLFKKKQQPDPLSNSQKNNSRSNWRRNRTN